MKIGLLAYSSNTGLGYQTRDFYKNIPCEKVLIADISKYNNMPVDHSWCPKARISDGIPTAKDCEWLVDGVDVIFMAETPLNYHLLSYARSKGVKTVNQYNYEFCEYFRTPSLPYPDVMASPSTWGMDEVKRVHSNVVFWPMPVDTLEIKPRNIAKVKTFVHILGRPAAHDRNGTILFIDAAKILGKKYKYKVYMQMPKEHRTWEYYEPIAQAINSAQKELGLQLEIITDTPNNMDMYKEGDIFVLPRRYGGNCLPLVEALAHGMPAIMPDINPNNNILPKEWLVEAEKETSFKTSITVEVYKTNVEKLSAKMLEMGKGISKHSSKAKEIALNLSWEKQKDIYMKRFEDLCN